MLKSLKHAQLDSSYETELRKLIAVDLLLTDDFALDSTDPVESCDAYQILTERHRAGSLVLNAAWEVPIGSVRQGPRAGLLPSDGVAV